MSLLPINVSELPTVPFGCRSELPKVPGIYFALDEYGQILYLGRSVDIERRWGNHHRFKQLERLGCKQLAWLLVSDPSLLPSIESALISFHRPPLNNSPVQDASKKLASLRLDDETMKRIDAAISKFYAQVGGVPASRNAQMEAWVKEGLERMEARIREGERA